MLFEEIFCNFTTGNDIHLCLSISISSCPNTYWETPLSIPTASSHSKVAKKPSATASIGSLKQTENSLLTIKQHNTHTFLKNVKVLLNNTSNLCQQKTWLIYKKLNMGNLYILQEYVYILQGFPLETGNKEEKKKRDMN